MVGIVPRRATVFFAAVLLVQLGGCAHQGLPGSSVGAPPTLRLGAEELTAEAAADRVPHPDLLALNDEMREFADQYLRRGDQLQRLNLLHSSLRSPAFADVDYHPHADGTAIEAYSSGQANCLSYAHLFVAMSRYLGLKARYLSVELRPEWSRYGDQVALRRHVSVVVTLNSRKQFVVDIDPVPRERVAGTRTISDDEAAALFHSNLAMEALLEKDIEGAYAHSARAIELAEDTDYLWVNLGTIFRRAGQDEDAELSYQNALALNEDSGSAMNNLSVLYHAQGREQESEYWGDKVRSHRHRNPYYQIYLGEQAELDGDPETAIDHYLKAISIKRTDAEFYFRLAKVYHGMADPETSRHYLLLAIENARLVGERELYEAYMAKLPIPSVASLNE